MTGIDIAAEFRGVYRSRAAAMGAIARYCGAAGHERRSPVARIVEAVAATHQMGEVPALRAARGDMVLVRRPRDFSLGIVAMNGLRILIAAEVGFGPIAMDRAVRAWRV